MKQLALILLLLALPILNGCTSTPKVSANAERGITPTQAAAAETPHEGKPLQWGGVIVEVRNLAETTELQILAYPLKSNGRPDVSEAPTGRFIASKTGYLEPVDYSDGRQVTATGRLLERRDGKVGEAAYTFPVLNSDELVLWPEERTGETSRRVHFGLGVGTGGRTRGSIGIGVGF